MLTPPTVPYRQHSSASQSSAVPMEEGEEPNEERVQSVTDSGNEDRSKLSKVMSTEDEVARLTIEVRHMPQLHSSLALWCIVLPYRL